MVFMGLPVLGEAAAFVYLLFEPRTAWQAASLASTVSLGLISEIALLGYVAVLRARPSHREV